MIRFLKRQSQRCYQRELYVFGSQENRHSLRQGVLCGVQGTWGITGSTLICHQPSLRATWSIWVSSNLLLPENTFTGWRTSLRLWRITLFCVWSLSLSELMALQDSSWVSASPKGMQIDCRFFLRISLTRISLMHALDSHVPGLRVEPENWNYLSYARNSSCSWFCLFYVAV